MVYFQSEYLSPKMILFTCWIQTSMFQISLHFQQKLNTKTWYSKLDQICFLGQYKHENLKGQQRTSVNLRTRTKSLKVLQIFGYYFFSVKIHSSFGLSEIAFRGMKKSHFEEMKSYFEKMKSISFHQIFIPSKDGFAHTNCISKEWFQIMIFQGLHQGLMKS